MFLKSLVLRGFKTFAETTEIEFGPEARIPAVVGPNGCGKSNLLDTPLLDLLLTSDQYDRFVPSQTQPPWYWLEAIR